MILAALYFFIPAYIANMMPVFVRRIKFLGFPVDFGRKFLGRRILGANKTWRGIFFGIIGGFAVFLIQRFLFTRGVFTQFALVDYGKAPLFLGILLGFSALFGDIIESFLKRQLSIPPGRPWVPFDQLDFLISAILITRPWSDITLKDSLLTMIVVLFATMIVQFTGYQLKLKKDVL